VAAEPLADHLIAYTRTPADLVFTAPEGGPVQLSVWRPRFWAPAVEKAGLVHLRPHDLRHTAVALWIAADANPKEVAARTGHSSVSFALDRYGHLFSGSEQKLKDGLDALADGARATTTTTSADEPKANTEKNPNPIAHVARTPGDSDSAAQGA
jgi:integrase